MPIKERGPGADPAFQRWSGGVTWIAHPGERMRRASHALIDDGDVWLVEPVDAEGLDAVVADFGEVAGVVVLAAYHRRDAAAVARRHDVAVHLPAALAGLADDLDAPVETFAGALGSTGYEPVTVYDGVPWAEAALYHPDDRTLVVTEALVASDQLTGTGERLAVMPYVRLLPPRGALSGLVVDRVLVGHGEPVLSDADAALETALADARRGAPGYYLRNVPYLVRAAAVALRD